MCANVVIINQVIRIVAGVTYFSNIYVDLVDRVGETRCSCSWRVI